MTVRSAGQVSLSLTRIEAAKLCGLTPSGFDGWVRRGIVPPPIMGTKRWSRVQLERALAGQSWVPPESCATSAEQGKDNYEAWRLEDDERNKHRPVHGLNKRQESALRALTKYGPSNGKDIGGAGEATFRYLAERGLALRQPDGWRPTGEGIAEVERTDTWLHWYDRTR